MQLPSRRRRHVDDPMFVEGLKALGLALGSAIGSVLGLPLGLVVLEAPALAQTQTIAPADAKAHVGQTVTIEGPVGNVYTARSGMTFIDIGGRYPDNDFAAVIFGDDTGKFPNIKALDGKIVDVTGAVSLYRGKPEIILKSVDQVKAK